MNPGPAAGAHPGAERPPVRAVRGALRRAGVVLSLAALASLLLLWDAAFVVLMRGRLHMNDFGKVYYATRSHLDAGSLYGPSPATRLPVAKGVEMDFWNLNPPHLHALVLPLARLPEDEALRWWAALNGLALVGALALIGRELRIDLTPQQALLCLLGLLAFSGTAMVLVTGQFSFLLMLLVSAAWVLARRRRWTAAGALIGVAVSLKLFLGVFLPYLLLTRRWRGALGAALGLGAAVLAGLAAFGLEPYRAWTGRLGDVAWSWASMNASLPGFFSRLLGPSPYFTPALDAPATARLLSGVGCAAIAVAMLRPLLRDRGEGSLDRHFALLLAGSLLMSPLGWTYYLWILLGPLLATLREARRAGPLSGPGAPGTRALLVAAGLGFLVPYPFAALLQPSWFGTATLGSVYFWSLLALWAASLRLSGAPAAPPGAASPAGGAR